MIATADPNAGLTNREAKIMDAWDRGSSIQKIAAQLRMPRKAVQRIISHYDGRHDERNWLEEATGGNAAFLAALGRAHPEKLIGGSHVQDPCV